MIFVITILLLLAFAVAICILIFGSTLITAILIEDQSTSTTSTFDAANFNIYGGVKFVFAQIVDFLESGIDKGRASSANLLAGVNSTFLVTFKKRFVNIKTGILFIEALLCNVIL